MKCILWVYFHVNFSEVCRYTQAAVISFWMLVMSCFSSGKLEHGAMGQIKRNLNSFGNVISVIEMILGGSFCNSEWSFYLSEHSRNPQAWSLGEMSYSAAGGCYDFEPFRIRFSATEAFISERVVLGH